MRTATRNKENNLRYSLNIGVEEIYQRDSEGNIKYIIINGVQTPMSTGEKKVLYSLPEAFSASLAMAGGEKEAREFGLSLNDYTATITYLKGSLPITETSIIWAESEVGYIDEEHTIVDEKTADYTVVKISNSINFTKAILRKITK